LTAIQRRDDRKERTSLAEHFRVDHSSDDIITNRQADLEALFSQPWFETVLADERFAPLREASQNLRTPEEALATYQMLNSRVAGRLDSELQWLSMIDRDSPNNVGRTRVAEWETRNLRQVANIREVIARQPGARVLVIAGSGHKAWFDAYLGMMSDVEVVDAQRALR
jgi:hypothetical protein